MGKNLLITGLLIAFTIPPIGIYASNNDLSNNNNSNIGSNANNILQSRDDTHYYDHSRSYDYRYNKDINQEQNINSNNDFNEVNNSNYQNQQSYNNRVDIPRQAPPITQFNQTPVNNNGYNAGISTPLGGFQIGINKVSKEGKQLLRSQANNLEVSTYNQDINQIIHQINQTQKLQDSEHKELLLDILYNRLYNLY